MKFMKKLDLSADKFISVFLILIFVSLDQITKYLTRMYLREESLPIIRDLFHLTYVENRGIAFGFMQGTSVLFAILSIFVIIFLLFFYVQQKNKKLSNLHILSWSMIFIIAGAIGNLIDRVSFGFVTDMIDFKGIWSFVFNVADMYIVCGFIVLGIYILLFDKESKI